MDWRDYAQRLNPVAAALMTRMHIAPEDRPHVKLACLRLLRQLNMDAAKSALIGRFLEHYIRLGPQEEARFDAELRIMPPEEQTAMLDYYTSWELKGIEIGRQEAVKTFLEARFGPSAAKLFERLETLPPERLQALLSLAATAESLDDFASHIPAPAA